MNKGQIAKIKAVFNKYPEIKLAYFFGSRAACTGGLSSDYDFAVYLHKKNGKKAFDCKIALITELSRILKTDRVDVVLLNSVQNPTLKFAVINDGKLVFERPPYRILAEPLIMSEYFDFHDMLARHNLTRGTEGKHDECSSDRK